MEDDELISSLEQDEARSRPYRAGRLRFLLQEYGPEGIRLFHGGAVSALAFEEVRQAYLHGLFMACTIMSQVCVEHMLAGLFRAAGRDDLDRASFETLLRQARDTGFLSQADFDLFNRLRQIRNPYTHSRAPGSPGSVMHRAVTSDIPFEGLMVQDAELAVRAILGLCQRPPFCIPSGDGA
jgi:HEPN domain-containing protein